MTPPGIRRAILALAVLLHVAGVAAVFSSIPGDRPPPAVFRIFNDAVHRLGPGADFFALYHAGVEAGRGGNLYTRDADGRTPPFYAYRYLPVFAQTGGRLVALLPPWTAYVLWVLCLEAALAANLFLTAGLLGRETMLRAAPVWLLFTPLLLELYMGQFTMMAATGLMATVWLLSRERSRPALLAWLISVAIKMYPLVLLPLWIRRRLLGGAALAVGALALATLPAFLAHGDWWEGFYYQNVEAPPVNGFQSGNFGLVYLLTLCGWHGLGLDPGLWSGVMTVVQAALLGGATLVVLAGRRVTLPAGVSVLLLAYLLAGFQVWEHHHVLLLPVGMFLLMDAGPGSWARRLTLAALVMAALPTPFVFWDTPDPAIWDPTLEWPLVRRIALPAMKTIPTLVMFAVAVRFCLREGAGVPRWRVRRSEV